MASLTSTALKQSVSVVEQLWRARPPEAINKKLAKKKAAVAAIRGLCARWAGWERLAEESEESAEESSGSWHVVDLEEMDEEAQVTSGAGQWKQLVYAFGVLMIVFVVFSLLSWALWSPAQCQDPRVRPTSPMDSSAWSWSLSRTNATSIPRASCSITSTTLWVETPARGLERKWFDLSQLNKLLEMNSRLPETDQLTADPSKTYQPPTIRTSKYNVPAC